MAEAIERKICGTCGKPKPTSEFHRNRKTKDGLSRNCIPCRNAIWRKWYEANKEKKRRLKRERWHVVGLERARANATRYQHENPERKVVWANARRARKMGVRIEPADANTIHLERIKGQRCAYCGASASHADHVVALARGGDHAPWNLVMACQACNGAKHSRLLGDFLREQQEPDLQVYATRQAAASFAGSP